MTLRRLLVHGTFLCGSLFGAAARSAPPDEASPGGIETFRLGEITVTAPRTHREQSALGGSVVTQQELRKFNRETLDQALNLVPGASISDLGARNETDIWIRGFDRWRVPLYQDGVPIYLPVDNRVDFGRFNTSDIAEIQVAKGFASVIDGPGALGGSVNLVSRTVRKPLEAELRSGISTDSSGSLNGIITDAFAGTRQDNWFVQGAASFLKQPHFRLSDDFQPGTYQASGNRVRSAKQDYKLNFKIGYTPGGEDEYTLNVIDQVGEKGNPPPDSVIPPASLNAVKYWDWPSWDKQSVYFLSRTGIDARGSFVKARVYYDRFYNQLDSYDTIAYDSQNTPKSFNSTYDDRGAGGILELDEQLWHGLDTLRFSAQTRWDQHNETESTRNAPKAPWYDQPWETAEELTSSAAAENIWHLTRQLDLRIGGSYDYRWMIGDSQFVASGARPPFGYSYAYPVSDKDAINGEAAVVYRIGQTGAAHLSYADRARFPTLFEMYSTRFGTFVNNPDLRPERSHYLQAGWNDLLAGFRIGVNVFYARVTNAIGAVAISPTVSKNENVGVEHHTGYEIELSRKILRNLSLGMNYSYLDRENVSGIPYATDTPRNKLFVYGTWNVTDTISLIPSGDIESNRLLQDPVNNQIYRQGGAFAVFAIKAAWQPTRSTTLEGGVTNLTDQNYVLAGGYHAPGRSYFVNARVGF